jgi:pimeloyl-ACP methyl ester carboxylesterase
MKFIICLAALWAMTLGNPALAKAEDAASTLSGEKSSWHGFDRYDFIMDEHTLAITPSKALEGEGNGVRDPEPGQRRCILVVPKQAMAGNPWSWQGCYWDHQPQTEVELLKRGLCIAYISASASLPPGKEWDAWYQFLTEKHGLSAKPVFIGMSRGGLFAYRWATTHPDKVSCLYVDNPASDDAILMKLGDLAKNDVPLFHVCGSFDPLYPDCTAAIEGIYEQFGGRISVMIKEGYGHHPHSLHDPTPMADFIIQSLHETNRPAPAFAVGKFRKTAFFSTVNSYRNFPGEGTYITCRGPFFTGAFDRYEFELPGVESFTTVIAPQTAAPGNPWVLRPNGVRRDSVVDQALLAKGYHIVSGAVPYNEDGPQLAQWNLIYKHLIENGFSKKPVMEGDGAGAGEAYAWAMANPDKVSCIYAENPVMHSHMTNTPLLENLGVLAKAGVPLLHVCGSLDPWLNDHTRAVEKRYHELGGQITVIIKEGVGHYPLSPSDPQPVIDFISKNTAP